MLTALIAQAMLSYALASQQRALSLSFSTSAEVSAGDVDGDGVREVLVRHGRFSEILTLYSLSDSQPATIPAGSPGDLRFAIVDDIDGDGRDDYVRMYVAGSDHIIQILSALDLSVLQTVNLGPTAVPVATAVRTDADFDADSRNDMWFIVATPTAHELRAYSGRTGALIRQFAVTTLGGATEAVGLRDTNSDTHDDVAVLVRRPPQQGLDYITVFSGRDGAALGTFSAAQSRLHSLSGAGDVNGDGVTDFLCSGNVLGPPSPIPLPISAETYAVSSGDMTAFRSTSLQAPLLTTPIVGLGDVDADAHGDYAVAIPLSAVPTVHVISGKTGNTLSTLMAPGANPRLLGPAGGKFRPDLILTSGTGQGTRVDAYTFPRFELVDGADFVDPARIPVWPDPWPDPATDDILMSSPMALRSGGSPRDGVCADGVSRLLIRLPVPGPGTVTFSLNAGAYVHNESTGRLASPGSSWSTNGLVTSLATQPNSTTYYAFATYRSPLDFVRPAFPQDDQAIARAETITAVFTPQGTGAPRQLRVPIQVCRPGVVLCHGLWSNAGTWKGPFRQLADGLVPQFPVYNMDYFATNYKSFEDNLMPVKSAITTLLNDLRTGQFNGTRLAASQVDWVGHSMGGLLPRAYYRYSRSRHHNLSWGRNDNYGAGDFHKLILLNSPQSGSPWGNEIVRIVDGDGSVQAFVRQKLLVLFDEVKYRIGKGHSLGGAVRDLAEGSDALNALGKTEIRARSILGTGAESLVSPLDDWGAAYTKAQAAPNASDASNLFWLMDRLSEPWTLPGYLLISRHKPSSPLDVYGIETHDTIVLRSSQVAGLDARYTTHFTARDFVYGHSAVTANQQCYDETIRLLTAPSSAFAPHLPPPETSAPTKPRLPWRTSPRQGLRFVQPSPSAVVKPGQTIQVQVEGIPPFSPVSVELWGNGLGRGVTLGNPPFRASIVVPPTLAGDYFIVARGIDVTGERRSATLLLPVQVEARILALTPSQPRYDFSYPGETGQLSVSGLFDDNVVRDLSDSAVGTTYRITPSGVASVRDDDGHIVALAQGDATLTVSYRDATATLPIKVKFPTVVRYGLGVPGTGDIEPSFRTGPDVPTAGNASFALEVDGLRGATTGQLLVSRSWAKSEGPAAPLLVDIASSSLIQRIPFRASGSAAGAGTGSATIPFPIPATARAGTTYYLQVVAIDPGAERGWSATNGMAVTVQPPP